MLIIIGHVYISVPFYINMSFVANNVKQHWVNYMKSLIIIVIPPSHHILLKCPEASHTTTYKIIVSGESYGSTHLKSMREDD